MGDISDDTSRLCMSYENLTTGEPIHESHHGSGVRITLEDLDGRLLMERTTVHAEDFEPVQKALIDCLKRALEHRQLSLTNQLAQIKRATGYE